jgi:Cu/Ag efflux protein CusF
MKSRSTLALIIALALPAAPLIAAHAAPADNAQQASASMSEGEIRKIDKDAGKITIRHGELKNLDMPPMTMVFRVQEPAMIDQVKVGDRIEFVAEKVGGQFTVTQIAVKK